MAVSLNNITTNGNFNAGRGNFGLSQFATLTADPSILWTVFPNRPHRVVVDPQPQSFALVEGDRRGVGEVGAADSEVGGTLLPECSAGVGGEAADGLHTRLRNVDASVAKDGGATHRSPSA